MRREMRLKTTIGLVVHRFKHLSGENMGFKENHGRDYTPMAYICNQKKHPPGAAGARVVR